MLAQATLTIDLEAIEHNARAVVSALSDQDISIVGVTKVACGDPHVARAMLAGGVSALGESRLENMQRLRDAGIEAPLWLCLLYTSPSPRDVEESRMPSSA